MDTFFSLILVIFIDQENSFHLGRVNKPLNRYPDVPMAPWIIRRCYRITFRPEALWRRESPHITVATITKEGSIPESQFNEGVVISNYPLSPHPVIPETF
jgi:hypothetical protein